ncbi:hypothetical protein Tco_0064236 [Tanacetum coccineum]
MAADEDGGVVGWSWWRESDGGSEGCKVVIVFVVAWWGWVCFVDKVVAGGKPGGGVTGVGRKLAGATPEKRERRSGGCTSAGTEGPIPPKEILNKVARKEIELKAKALCLEATMESKKMQKTILKQQYENFAASRYEGLDKTYDRFQKLTSQLEIHGEVISQEDANLKLLRSLPSA